MSFYSYADYLQAQELQGELRRRTGADGSVGEYWKSAAQGNRGELPYVVANTARDVGATVVASAAGTAGALTLTRDNPASNLAERARSEWRSEGGREARREGGLRELPYTVGEFLAPAGVGSAVARTVGAIPRVAQAADVLVSRGVPLVAGTGTEAVIQGAQSYVEGASPTRALLNVPYAFGVNLFGGTFIPRYVGRVSRNIGSVLSPTEKAAYNTMRSRNVPYGRELGEGVLQNSLGYSSVPYWQRFVLGEMTEQTAPDIKR